MRILHVIGSIDSSQGGPVEGIKQLAVQYARRGHQVEIVSADSPDSRSCRSFPLPLHPLGPGLLIYGFNLTLIPWIRRNVSRYDIVVVNGLWQYHSLATWWALRNSSTPYVVFTHGMLDPWFKQTYPLKHAKKWLYWAWGEYQVLRDAAAVLFTSNEERLLARQSFSRYQAQEVVINYGTAGPPTDIENLKSEFLAAFPKLENKRLVLFLGRVHPKKGCDLVLEAFARVLASGPDFQLVMAGPDQTGWRSSLMRMASTLQISDQVTWTGLIEGRMKWGALAAAEILFLPSHQENFGIVVAEALACSLPVLISNKVNIWREVEEDEAGFVSEDNLEGASLLLQMWAALPAEQQWLIRKNARRCFERRFEMATASEKLITVLYEIAHRARNTSAPESSGKPN